MLKAGQVGVELNGEDQEVDDHAHKQQNRRSEPDQDIVADMSLEMWAQVHVSEALFGDEPRKQAGYRGREHGRREKDDRKAASVFRAGDGYHHKEYPGDCGRKQGKDDKSLFYHGFLSHCDYPPHYIQTVSP